MAKKTQGNGERYNKKESEVRIVRSDSIVMFVEHEVPNTKKKYVEYFDLPTLVGWMKMHDKTITHCTCIPHYGCSLKELAELGNIISAEDEAGDEDDC